MFDRVALIDNLQDPDRLVLHEGYEASIDRYMAAMGGNTGNLAFVKGTKTAIEFGAGRIGWDWTSERVRERADAIVISCANQLGAHADLGSWADALERFGLPVVLIGLGAQRPNYDGKIELPKGTIRFLEVVTELRPTESPNIAVRGDFTKQVLNQYGFDSVPLGCPSLFISTDDRLGQTIVERSSSGGKQKLAIAAGNPYHAGNLPFERSIVANVEDIGGAYITQHPSSVVSLALGNKIEDEKMATIAHSLGLGSVPEAYDWFRRNAYSFHDVSSWMNYLRHFEAVLGARYHGVALGVQAGVPGLVVNIDSRTKELAETTGIPTLAAAAAAEMSLSDLANTVRWTKDQGELFDANRKSLAMGLRRFLDENRVECSSQLKTLAES